MSAARALAPIGLVLASGCRLVDPEPEPAPRTNVVLVMADDLGWGDPGYAGNDVYLTPHLDAMAANGAVFERFYAAAPVCSPTRGSCLTGRHPFRYGIRGANSGHLRRDEVTLAEVLRDAGYATGHFGKWHLGTLAPDYSGKGAGRNPEQNFCPPDACGFQTWFSTEFAVATWDPYAPENSHLGRNQPYDTRALYWRDGENVTEPIEGCDSRAIVDEALAFLDEAVADERPFFAVVWYHAPHAPVVGGPPYLELYADQPEDVAHYGATITALDAELGRLRARLRDLGVADHTLVWFCSDNGPEGNPAPRDRHQGSTGGLRGRKRSLYEGGVRVPGVVEWPARIPEPLVIGAEAPAVTSDLYPTILALAGLEDPGPPRPLDGVNLLPWLEGGAPQRTAPIGFAHGNRETWVESRYKLVHAPDDVWELYDLLADPSETTDLSAELPETVSRMREALASWRRSVDRDAADPG